MTQIAIVFLSGFGHTKVVAERMKAGADMIPGTQTRLIQVEEIDAHWAASAASPASWPRLARWPPRRTQRHRP